MNTAHYDTIVVGAGPAGSIAALRLAGSGARVLLLERQALGRDKPCGGGLTPRAWQGLEIAIDDLVMSRADSTEIRHGSSRSARVPLGDRPVLMVQRRVLDERLALEAARARAELHDREAVVSVEATRDGVRVTTAKAKYWGETLLLATGAEGSLRASVGLPPQTTLMAVGLEVDGPARAPYLDASALTFDYSVPDGYAWAFAKGDCWNVGILSTSRQVAPQLRSRLRAFIDEIGVRFDPPGGDAVRHARGHRIPLHSPRGRLTAGRAALIGDAAALADPLFGEGIAQALISGRLAATAVQGLLRGERSTLSGYQLALERATGAHLRRMRWLARAVYARPALAVRALGFAPNRAVARRVSTEWFAPSGER